MSCVAQEKELAKIVSDKSNAQREIVEAAEKKLIMEKIAQSKAADELNAKIAKTKVEADMKAEKNAKEIASRLGEKHAAKQLKLAEKEKAKKAKAAAKDEKLAKKQAKAMAKQEAEMADIEAKIKHAKELTEMKPSKIKRDDNDYERAESVMDAQRTAALKQKAEELESLAINKDAGKKEKKKKDKKSGGDEKKKKKDKKEKKKDKKSTTSADWFRSLYSSLQYNHFWRIWHTDRMKWPFQAELVVESPDILVSNRMQI